MLDLGPRADLQPVVRWLRGFELQDCAVEMAPGGPLLPLVQWFPGFSSSATVYPLGNVLSAARRPSLSGAGASAKPLERRKAGPARRVQKPQPSAPPAPPVSGVFPVGVTTGRPPASVVLGPAAPTFPRSPPSQGRPVGTGRGLGSAPGGGHKPPGGDDGSLGELVRVLAGRPGEAMRELLGGNLGKAARAFFGVEPSTNKGRKSQARAPQRGGPSPP